MHLKATRLSTAGSGESESPQVESFLAALSRHGLALRRSETTVLQVNVGLLCNQACKHCHLEAAPDRAEVMTLVTFEQVASFAEKGKFKTIDVTGGAPELNPYITTMIETFSSLAPRVMMRTNLTALSERDHETFVAALSNHRVVVVASLPSLDASQLEAQRGERVWEKSLAALRNLNRRGYGQPGSGLELNLVSNPTGAFLPPSQEHTETRFRLELERRWGIVFSNLYTFANAPSGKVSTLAHRVRQFCEVHGQTEFEFQSLYGGKAHVPSADFRILGWLLVRL